MNTVIFDFDGTLADSLSTIVQIFEDLTGNGHLLTPKEMAELRHLPIPVVAKRLNVPMWRVPYLLYRGRRIMQRRINTVVMYEGLDLVVRRLHQSGYRLLVASSNSEHNIRAFLRNNAIDQYITHVYGGIGLFSKSGALRNILAHNRISTANAVYVGDETRDLEACKAIGLQCIAVTWGFANPEFLVKHDPFALVETPTELEQAIASRFSEAATI